MIVPSLCTFSLLYCLETYNSPSYFLRYVYLPSKRQFGARVQSSLCCHFGITWRIDPSTPSMCRNWTSSKYVIINNMTTSPFEARLKNIVSSSVLFGIWIDPHFSIKFYGKWVINMEIGGLELFLAFGRAFVGRDTHLSTSGKTRDPKEIQGDPEK